MFKVFVRIPFSKLLCQRSVKNCELSLLQTIQLHPISTSTMNLEEAAAKLKTNPFFDKYAQKIATLQNSSPEEFLARLKKSEEKKNTETSSKTQMRPLVGQPGKPKPLSTVFTKPKLLADVMKIDLIEDKTSDEINQIWIDYHKNKDCIAASVPLSTFDLIVKRGETFPLFLLPLPRDQGYEFIVCQFSGNEVHFTPLISYQTHKENSPECLTIVYYPDLRETKGLILMKGEFNKDVLNTIEAQCLANELQLYYGEENEKTTRLLERFTYSPDEFKHMDLIANIETLSF